MAYRFIYTCGSRQLEFSRDTQNYITDIDGISENDVNINETELTTQVGSSMDSLHVKPKNLTIEGAIKADWSKRAEILRTVISGQMATLRFIDEEHGIDRYIEGTPSKTPDFTTHKNHFNFQFTFHVFFPYWKDIKDTTISFTENVSEFILPRSFSNTEEWYISRRVSTPLQTVYNRGSADAGFIVRWTAEADAKGPRLTKVNTQETISFSDLSLQIGDVLEVSTYDDNKYTHLIRDGVTTNVFNYFDDDSTFFKLDVGYNSVRGGATSNEESVYCDLIFNNTYVGI